MVKREHLFRGSDKKFCKLLPEVLVAVFGDALELNDDYKLIEDGPDLRLEFISSESWDEFCGVWR